MRTPAIQDRAAGFIGDALGLGPRWYYDLDALRRDFGDWIDGYTAPKPGAKYHAGMKAGESSQTGLIMLLLLRSLAERGVYDEANFTRQLDLVPHLAAAEKEQRRNAADVEAAHQRGLVIDVLR